MLDIHTIVMLTLGLLALFPSTVAKAAEQPLVRHAETIATPRVQVDVLVNGRPIPQIPLCGRIYLPLSRLGDEYIIRVRNFGPRRVLAMIAIDGLSVFTGARASYHDPGYVINPHGQVLARGWRRGDEKVAAFRFVSREESQAYQKGQMHQMGVINVTVIEEQGCRRPNTFCEGAQRTTGTGCGREIHDPVRRVHFVRGPNRCQYTFIYDLKDNLRRAGI